MIQALLLKVGAGIVGLGFIIGGWFGYQQQMGATIPISVAVWESTIASKITTTDTSLTVVTGTDKAGNALNGYMCFTLDGGKTNEEFICGTASSTAVTTLLRGLDPVTAATSTALAKEHRAGANIKITDWPQLGILSRILNGDETIPNTLSYATDTASFTLNQQIPNKLYVDTVATSGAANASNLTIGLVERAEEWEIVNSAATGDLGGELFVRADYFSTTTQASTTVPVTDTTGKLSQGFLNLDSAFTWNGNQSWASSTSLDFGTSTSLILNGTTTVNGSTTFTVAPDASADPVSDNQLGRKSYIDTVAKDFTTYASTTGSRATSTQYQAGASTGKLVMINFTTTNTQLSGSAGHLTAYIGVASATTSVAKMGTGASNANEEYYWEMTFWVPPAYYYMIESQEGANMTLTITNWWELDFE